MQPHVKNYLDFFGYDESYVIPCEMCGSVATDIHHVIFRSKFGSKTKHERDAPNNLIALCRTCHDKAHGPEAQQYKLIFIEIINRRK